MTTKRDERKRALDAFSEARAVYLQSAGWALSERNTPGGPRWWCDPAPRSPYDQGEQREDQAVLVQEGRDNAVVYR